MFEFLSRYRQHMQHRHGWDVAVRCTGCGQESIPSYKGWTPSNAISFGEQATIYANLECPRCARNLRNEASEKLTHLFHGVEIPPGNKSMLFVVICLAGILPLCAALVIWLGSQAGWWNQRAFVILAFLSVVIVPTIAIVNYRIASIRSKCPCGVPDYAFMGMLGRSYCYRCSSCGNLLRLRD